MRACAERGAAIAVVLSLILGACDPASREEKRMRARIAGEYGFDKSWDEFTHVHVLTLRPDSRWTRVTTAGGGGMAMREHIDSGNYRIQGVTVNLHSEVYPDQGSTRFTYSGDTLYGANAGLTYMVTGIDMKEDVLVRVRQAQAAVSPGARSGRTNAQPAGSRGIIGRD